MKYFSKVQSRVLVLFIILACFFLVVSFYAGHTFDSRVVDFAAYWQAGHMVLTGQNVYDSQAWVSERYLLGTAFHSEPTFQYPLPFAIFMAPWSLLSVRAAYILWIFLGQLAILSAVLVLLSFYPKPLRYAELAVIAGIYLFRPTFIVISNGQVMPFLLLFIVLSIYLFRNKRWFWGGLVLSLLSLKPSIALTIFILVAFWLIIKRQWRAIGGLFSGGFILLFIGMASNLYWVFDYLSIGQQNFTKYYGMQTTLWGLTGLFFQNHAWGIIGGALLSLSALFIEGRFLLRSRFSENPLASIATILPVSLLAAPYSWSYDQIFLVIPMIYLLLNIADRHGERLVTLVMGGFVTFSVILVAMAYWLEHDVWSLLISGIVWLGVLFFAQKYQVPWGTRQVEIN